VFPASGLSIRRLAILRGVRRVGAEGRKFRCIELSGAERSRPEGVMRTGTARYGEVSVPNHSLDGAIVAKVYGGGAEVLEPNWLGSLRACTRSSRIKTGLRNGMGHIGCGSPIHWKQRRSNVLSRRMGMRNDLKCSELLRERADCW